MGKYAAGWRCAPNLRPPALPLAEQTKPHGHRGRYRRNPAAHAAVRHLLCLRQEHLGRDADFPAARGTEDAAFALSRGAGALLARESVTSAAVATLSCRPR